MKTLILLLLSLGLASAHAGEPVAEKERSKDKAEATQPTRPAEPAAPAEPAKPAKPDKPEMKAASVERSQFTSGIENREPVDDLNNLDTTSDTAYFFTEIRGGQGQTITHEWWHEGELMAEVDFDVKGNRWRVWSSKDFMEDWTGEWRVRVTDDVDRTLAEETFRYVPAPSSSPDTGAATRNAAEDAATDGEPVDSGEEDDDDGGI